MLRIKKFFFSFRVLTTGCSRPRSQTFPVDSSIINTFAFVGYIAPATATQLCLVTAARDNTSTNDHGCVPIKLDLDRQRSDLSPWPSFAAPFLEEISSCQDSLITFGDKSSLWDFVTDTAVCDAHDFLIVPVWVLCPSDISFALCSI